MYAPAPDIAAFPWKSKDRGIDMDLVQLFLEAWENSDDSPCVIDEGIKLSLPEIGRRALMLARRIHSEERNEQPFIAILLPNSAHFATAFWAALLTGKTAMPLNFMLKPAEFLPLFEHTRSSLLLAHSLFKPLVQALNSSIHPPLNAIYLDEFPWEGEGKLKPSPDNAHIAIPSDPHRHAVLLFTAGTSAAPKAVLLSHQNLVSNMEGCQEVLQTGKEDAFLGILPFFHSFGLTTSFLLPMLKGSRIALLRVIQPQTIAETIHKERITALIMVPSLFGIVAKFPGIRHADFSSVRMTISGGGPLSPSLEQAFPVLTGIRIYNGYGLTEASPVVSVNTREQYKMGSIGPPLFNVSVSVHGENGAPLPTGQIGEFYVKGDNVMKGYLGLENETREAITPEGMLRTGDMGYVDQEGYLFITGRKKELIICGGENVHPLEIENALASHPDVEEAVVIGVADSLRGEHPRAFVKLREGQTASVSDLRRFARTILAPFKVPREFVFVPDFPRNSLGKILKRELLQLINKNEKGGG